MEDERDRPCCICQHSSEFAIQGQKIRSHKGASGDLKIGCCYSVLVFISMVPCLLRDDVSGGLKAAAHSKSHYS
jgi:hypothetical protein